MTIFPPLKLWAAKDLLSALIHPPGGGAALETDEIITMCLLLLAAGHETTANLIGNGTLAPPHHPNCACDVVPITKDDE